jgi:predicted site-specific integrase-resolvase
MKKLTARQISERLGVNRYTVYNWYHSGRIPLHINPLNGYFFMYEQEFQSFYHKTFGKPYQEES